MDADRERAQEIFDRLAADMETQPDVARARMFGTIGIGVRGKMFAFIDTIGELVVKVGEHRADELERDGVAQRMTMRERVMREWVAVPLAAEAIWPEIMEEGRAFLDEITPR